MTQTKEDTLPQVLIVENSRTLNRMVQKTLEDAGLETHSVTTGTEAVTWAVDKPNTLMLLDYMLPDLNGNDVIDVLDECSCKMSFILLADQDDEQKAIDLKKKGGHNYLIKDRNFLDLLPSMVTDTLADMKAQQERLDKPPEWTLKDQMDEAKLDEMGTLLRDTPLELNVGQKEMEKERPKLASSREIQDSPGNRNSRNSLGGHNSPDGSGVMEEMLIEKQVQLEAAQIKLLENEFNFERLDCLQAELKEARRRLEITERVLDKSAERCERLDELELQFFQQENKLGTMRTQLMEADSRERERREDNAIIRSLKYELVDKERTIETIEDQLIDSYEVRGRLEDVETDLADTQVKLRSAESLLKEKQADIDRLKDVESDLEDTRNELEFAELTLQKKQSDIDRSWEVEAELIDTRTKLKAAGLSLKNERSYIDRLREVEAELTETRNKLDSAESSLKEKQSDIDRLQEVEGRLVDTRNRLEVTEGQFLESQAELARLTGIEGDLVEGQHRLRATEALLEESRGEIECLEKKVIRSAEYRTRLESVEGQLQERDTELGRFDDVERQLADSKIRLMNADERLKKNEVDLRELKSTKLQLAENRMRLDTTMMMFREKEEKLKSLDGIQLQLTEKEVQLELHQKRLEESRTRIEQLEATELKLARSRTEQKAIARKLKTAHEQIKRLEAMEPSLIRARKKVDELETTVHDRERELAEAQKHARIGSWEWKAKDNSLYLSKQLQAMFELTDEHEYSSIEKLLEAHVHPEDRECLARATRPSASDGESFIFRIVRPGGETRWLAATPPCIVTTGDHGLPQTVNGTLQDISERKLAEEALKTAEDGLDAIMRTASQHLMSPLSTLRVVLSLAKEIETDQLLSRIPTMSDQPGASSKEGLLKDLVQHSPSDWKLAENQQLELGQLLDMMSNDLAAKVHECQGPGDMAMPFKEPQSNEPHSISDLFTFFITNTLLSLNHENSPKVEVGWSEKEGHYQYRVNDDGIVIGIDPSYLSNIFECINGSDEPKTSIIGSNRVPSELPDRNREQDWATGDTIEADPSESDPGETRNGEFP